MFCTRQSLTVLLFSSTSLQLLFVWKILWIHRPFLRENWKKLANWTEVKKKRVRLCLYRVYTESNRSLQWRGWSWKRFRNSKVTPIGFGAWIGIPLPVMPVFRSFSLLAAAIKPSESGSRTSPITSSPARSLSKFQHHRLFL